MNDSSVSVAVVNKGTEDKSQQMEMVELDYGIMLNKTYIVYDTV